VVTSLFPAVDPKNGVVVHPSLIGEQGVVVDNTAQNLLVVIDPAGRDEAVPALKAAFPNTYAVAVPPLDVGNLQRVSSAPPLLALVIGVLALASLLHAVILITRGSRHDLTVLRVLGASTRQARTSLFWMATALVGPAVLVGALIGLIGGQIGWRAIAEGRALDQPPVVVLPSIAAVIIGGFVIANAVAWLPARRSIKASPAMILRAQ
jgi:predicted lysophospholipase L1 biosynthesis ABC-type transport system permease subunit